MKYAKILTALVLISIGLLLAPEREPAFACSGSSGSVCTVTTTTCLKSMVMAKSSPGVVLLPASTSVMFNIPVKLFLIANNPAPGCAPCPMPVSPTSARIDMVVSPLLGGPNIAIAGISTADGTMTLPGASPIGVFNNYSVPITVPAGTARGAYKVVGKTTVFFSDGLSLSQSGDTVVCLVEPAPGNPSVPRLDLQRLTPSFPMMAGGDQHTMTYRITNNDPTRTLTVTAFATGKQAAARPQGANENQGIFAIANPFGDDFPIAFGPGPCLPLPGHPYSQPEIMMAIPPLAPDSFFDVFVDIRSYGMCASGSCSESTLRVEGTFSDGSAAFGCAGMAHFVDTSMPPTTCSPPTNDCNMNGIPDPIDIANGAAPDQNYNAVIDQCEEGNAPIIMNPVQINPPTVMAGQPIQVFVTALPDFGMPTTRTITNVFANGAPLSSGDGTHWLGTIPADSRPGPQTVYALARENNGAIATHIGVYNVLPMALALNGAGSRKSHPNAGIFDVSLPLSGSPGVECRTGGAGGNHTVVFTFNNPVVSGNAMVTSGIGSVSGPPSFSGNTMTINLAGVANAQTVTVAVSSVMDSFGQTLPSASVTAGFLLGDTNGNGSVNSTDVSQAKGQLGQGVSGSNFRNDINVNGTINASDVSQLKANLGTALPSAAPSAKR